MWCVVVLYFLNIFFYYKHLSRSNLVILLCNILSLIYFVHTYSKFYTQSSKQKFVSQCKPATIANIIDTVFPSLTLVYTALLLDHLTLALHCCK